MILVVGEDKMSFFLMVGYMKFIWVIRLKVELRMGLYFFLFGFYLYCYLVY